MQREILHTIHAGEQAIASETEPPTWKVWKYADYSLRAEHGERYSTQLFDNANDRMPDRIRARYRRCFAELVATGLVTAFSEFGDGGRITHAKLTEAGRHSIGLSQPDTAQGPPVASETATHTGEGQGAAATATGAQER